MAKLNHTKELQDMLDGGYISVAKHPSCDLYIYNYTRNAQYSNVWNSSTIKCRGLITDGDDNIIARPFEKFFNYEEIKDGQYDFISIPVGMSFKAYEKLDGSLGIMYWIDGVPYIATRGSFDSEQAIHASDILHKKYSDKFFRLDKTKTYLFEIIYPENHIVINYNDTDDIFLLAVIDTETGEESDIAEYSDVFNCAVLYDGVDDYTKIRDMFSGDNKEGFVIKFANNFRMKMKFNEYLRIHSLITRITYKNIEHILENHDMEEYIKIFETLDEENRIWVKKIIDDLTDEFNNIMFTMQKEYRQFDLIYKDNGKIELPIDAVNYYKTCTYPWLMMAWVKMQDIEPKIWKYVRKNIVPCYSVEKNRDLE